MRKVYRISEGLPDHPAYQITEDNFTMLLGMYKLPWDRFCKFMDENYVKFHENPDSPEFNQPAGSVDISDFGPGQDGAQPSPKPEGTDMADNSDDQIKRLIDSL